jgi:glycosyltransferase involved in cell wall biosynthesis
MKIWLVQPGEELPTDPGTPRLLRTGMIADILAGRGRDVVWWTSTFSHARKEQRSNDDTEIKVKANYTIRLLHSPGYEKNVSLRRIYDHKVLARKFRCLALRAEPPDIILCSMPTIEFSLAATQYGKERNVPVVLDLRDMWPDIFLDVAPKVLRPLARMVLQPMDTSLRTACKNATALFGITEEFLEWGLQKAGRPRNGLDAVFHHAYRVSGQDNQKSEGALEFWKGFGLSQKDDEFIACFFGVFGKHTEVDTVLEAARILQREGAKIKIVLCGYGDQYQDIRDSCLDLPNVVLPGFVNANQIRSLMAMASCGLAPLRNRKDFRVSIPNKCVEYLSASLPILSSLKGTTEKLLADNDCGITYPNNDPKALAIHLKNLASNRDRIIEMARNAGKVFETKFNSEKVLGQMCDTLESIACNSNNPSLNLSPFERLFSARR